jgi:branched-chain amino acid transport system substrate-binding protein
MRRRHLIAVGAAAGIGSPSFAAVRTPVIGLSLPISGVQAEVARDLEIGYRLALSATGARVDLQVMDDMSKPDLTAANLRKLADNPAVLVASGVVGTPHAEAAIPVARQTGLPLVGLRSGAQFLRTGQEGVYHLRSTFEAELDKVVAHCVGAGMKEMAILFSNDSFGKSSRDHLVKRLAESGITVISNVSVERGGDNIKSAVASTSQVVKGSHAPLGIALLLIAKPMLEAAREIRLNHQIIAPLFAMSFVATRDVATKPDPSLAGLGLVTAFPLPRASAQTMAVNFRRDAARYAPGVDIVESLTAFEGYFYGTVAARAVAGQSTRDGVMRELRTGLQLGSGMSITFDNQRVGYRYLEVVRKTADDGKLRS